MNTITDYLQIYTLDKTSKEKTQLCLECMKNMEIDKLLFLEDLEEVFLEKKVPEKRQEELYGYLFYIHQGIEKHKQVSRAWHNWQNKKSISMKAQDFVYRIPYVSVKRLRNLLVHYPKALLLISGATNIQWHKSEYVPSGSGIFGGYSNKRSSYHPCEIEFFLNK